LANVAFPLFLVALEPLAFVVALEANKKLKKVGSEIRRHGRLS
jgi:hypothetical protein